MRKLFGALLLVVSFLSFTSAIAVAAPAADPLCGNTGFSYGGRGTWTSASFKDLAIGQTRTPKKHTLYLRLTVDNNFEFFADAAGVPVEDVPDLFRPDWHPFHNLTFRHGPVVIPIERADQGDVFVTEYELPGGDFVAFLESTDGQSMDILSVEVLRCVPDDPPQDHTCPEGYELVEKSIDPGSAPTPEPGQIVLIKAGPNHYTETEYDALDKKPDISHYDLCQGEVPPEPPVFICHYHHEEAYEKVEVPSLEDWGVHADHPFDVFMSEGECPPSEPPVCEYDSTLPAGHPDCEPPPPPVEVLICHFNEGLFEEIVTADPSVVAAHAGHEFDVIEDEIEQGCPAFTPPTTTVPPTTTTEPPPTTEPEGPTTVPPVTEPPTTTTVPPTAPPTVPPVDTPEPPLEELPKTGVETWMLLLVGLITIEAGVLLMWWAEPQG